jgi:4'-phosphopantetheinyl transferase
MNLWEWKAHGSAGTDIWWLPATVRDDMAARLRSALAARERDRLAALPDQRHAQALGAVRGLVRTVLARRLGCEPSELHLDRSCEYCGGDHGRPRLAGQRGLEFSVSHSGQRAVLCVSGTRVGIDLEALTARPLPDRASGLARIILSDVEARELGDRANADLLLRCWVRKEAFLKLSGLGLAVAPSAVTTRQASAESVLVTGVPEQISGFAGSVIVDLPAPLGYVAALATRQPAERISHHVVGSVDGAVVRLGHPAWVAAARTGQGRPGAGREDPRDDGERD